MRKRKVVIYDEYSRQWEELKKEHIKLRKGHMTDAKLERLKEVEKAAKELFERMWSSGKD